ncbi:hypothetical protein Nmel_014089, partial [Mimus melanotis]
HPNHKVPLFPLSLEEGSTFSRRGRASKHKFLLPIQELLASPGLQSMLSKQGEFSMGTVTTSCLFNSELSELIISTNSLPF